RGSLAWRGCPISLRPMAKPAASKSTVPARSAKRRDTFLRFVLRRSPDREQVFQVLDLLDRLLHHSLEGEDAGGRQGHSKASDSSGAFFQRFTCGCALDRPAAAPPFRGDALRPRASCLGLPTTAST